MTDRLMPFQREERYIVIKRKHLTDGHETDIRGYLAEIGVGTIECVVIESDWPEYETVWAMIEARVAGTSAAEVPQWRCINCKHVVSRHLKPEHCPSCKWCQGFAEVARNTPLAAEGADPVLVAEDIERDIRIAIWNAGMAGGMGQDLTLAFIRRAMDEPGMKRALAALSQVPDPTLAREEGYRQGIEDAAKVACAPCQHDLGFDRETGPLGCSLGDGCVCLGTTLTIRALASKEQGHG